MKTNTNLKNIEKSVISAWLKASAELQVRVEAPFNLECDGTTFFCSAYVPDFGGQKGTILMVTLPPDFETNKELIKHAEKTGYTWSYLNGLEYANFDKEIFIEALSDWGYKGPLETKPSWV